MKIERDDLVDAAKRLADKGKEHPLISCGVVFFLGPFVFGCCAFPFVYLFSSEAEWERLMAEDETENVAESRAWETAEKAKQVVKAVQKRRKARKREREKRERQREREKFEHNQRVRMAWYTCQRAIKHKLQAPSTAEFAPTYKVKGGPTGKGYWLTKGYVDAENSFGAKLRYQAICKLKRKGDRFTVERAGVTKQ